MLESAATIGTDHWTKDVAQIDQTILNKLSKSKLSLCLYLMRIAPCEHLRVITPGAILILNWNQHLILLRPLWHRLFGLLVIVRLVAARQIVNVVVFGGWLVRLNKIRGNWLYWSNKKLNLIRSARCDFVRTAQFLHILGRHLRRHLNCLCLFRRQWLFIDDDRFLKVRFLMCHNRHGKFLFLLIQLMFTNPFFLFLSCDFLRLF